MLRRVLALRPARRCGTIFAAPIRPIEKEVAFYVRHLAGNLLRLRRRRDRGRTRRRRPRRAQFQSVSGRPDALAGDASGRQAPRLPPRDDDDPTPRGRLLLHRRRIRDHARRRAGAARRGCGRPGLWLSASGRHGRRDAHARDGRAVRRTAVRVPPGAGRHARLEARAGRADPPGRHARADERAGVRRVLRAGDHRRDGPLCGRRH